MPVLRRAAPHTLRSHGDVPLSTQEDGTVSTKAPGPLGALPEVDAGLGVHPVFLTVPRNDLIYVKVLLESFEGIGVMRSEEPFYGDDRALVVLLVVPDAAADAHRLLEEATTVTDLRLEPIDPGRLESLRRDLLSELDTP